MRLWFRRSKGRHALGAAVTALPSGPLSTRSSEHPQASGPGDVPKIVRPSGEVPAPPDLPGTLPAGVREPAASAALTSPDPESRVRLGFRDGSTALLDAEQAAALEELAGLLTSRG